MKPLAVLAVFLGAVLSKEVIDTIDWPTVTKLLSDVVIAIAAIISMFWRKKR